MPLEGHYERQTTPLRKLTPRELKVVFGILAVTLIAMIAVVAFTAGDSPPAVAKGCIRPTVAGITGAETLNQCGSEAIQTCAHASEYTGARAETIVSECEQRGIKF
jgi:hypothetical protein